VTSLLAELTEKFLKEQHLLKLSLVASRNNELRAAL
jgi:hypothetical protein